jgi:mRNA interferase RelE/StbE
LHADQRPGVGLGHFGIDLIIAYRYILAMKTVRYTTEALRNLKRHGNMAARIRSAMQEYTAEPTAHANNITQLVGSSASRMRVGDYRVIFVETDAELSVVKIGPRGGIYE